MWTRTSAKTAAIEGGFAYELWDGFTLLERVGGFPTAEACERAAEAAQRRALFPQSAEPLDPVTAAMTDAELLAELADIGTTLNLND